MDATAQLKTLIEDEPQLDIEFPQVFVQPKADSLSRGKADINKLLPIIKKSLRANNGHTFTQAYNQLLQECRPAVNWAKSSWDYLLTTEGIRYISRPEGEKMYCHGDYRAFSDKDFHRLIHKVFKECLFDYLKEGVKNYSFIFYIKRNLWKGIVRDYKKLEEPQDRCQRKLTLYSYLRCVPYEFLNRYHQETVNNVLGMLEPEEREIVEMYFIKFLKGEEIIKKKNITADTFCRQKKEILAKIYFFNPLVYALLLQIERY